MTYFPATKLQGATGIIIEPAREDGHLATIAAGVTVNNFPDVQGVTVSNFPEVQGVTVTNFPAVQGVTGTFWQAIQPVSAGQSGAWTVGITGTLPLPTGAATETSLSKLTITQGATLGTNTLVMAGAAASSTAPSYTSGNIYPLSVNDSGQLRVEATVSQSTVKPTYSASPAPVTVAAAATDVFTIYGSSSKTIKIRHISFKAIAQQNGYFSFYLKRRSSANTGGTSSSVTATKFDSTSIAATATVLAYTANPTALGTDAGNISVDRIMVTNTSSVGPSDDVLLYEDINGASQPITLRGTSEGLVINLDGQTIASNSFVFHVVWTEE